MNKYLFVILFFLLICNITESQDIHFSQYKEAPLLLNPAYTGNNKGDWRAGLNYREQWTKVAIPYNTFNVYYDRKVFLYSKVIMVGGYIMLDQISNTGLTKVSVSPSIAYRVDYSGNTINIGLQPGIGFFNLNTGLTHPDQFNYESGVFDNTLPTSDIGEKYSKLYPDIAFGATFSRAIKGFHPQIGIAFFHLNSPNISIYSSNSKLRVPVKTVVNFNLPIRVSNNVVVEPSSLIIRQRKSQEIIIGSEGSLNTKRLSELVDKLFLGLHYRNAKSKGLSSMVLIGGMEFRNIRLAISYDEYFNSVKSSTAIGSTFEVSITYTGISSFTDKFSLPCEVF